MFNTHIALPCAIVIVQTSFFSSFDKSHKRKYRNVLGNGLFCCLFRIFGRRSMPWYELSMFDDHIDYVRIAFLLALLDINRFLSHHVLVDRHWIVSVSQQPRGAQIHVKNFHDCFVWLSPERKKSNQILEYFFFAFWHVVRMSAYTHSWLLVFLRFLGRKNQIINVALYLKKKHKTNHHWSAVGWVQQAHFLCDHKQRNKKKKQNNWLCVCDGNEVCVQGSNNRSTTTADTNTK